MANVGARNLHKLFVGNIGWTIGSNELKYYFSKFGHVANAQVVFDKETCVSSGFGFVVFSSRDGYNAAANKTNHFIEGRVLRVEPVHK